MVMLLVGIFIFFPLFIALNGDAKSFEEYVVSLTIIVILIHWFLSSHS